MNGFPMLKSLSRPVRIVALAAFMVIAATMVSGVTDYGIFLNIGGLIIVVGGSIANAFLSYSRENVKQSLQAIMEMVKTPPAIYSHLHRDIRQFILWAYVVQQKGFLGLDQESTEKVYDPFMRYGLDMVVTGYSANNIRRMMHTVAEAEFERRCVPVTILRNMAANAPAFGMVGTLVGMVILLKNAGSDLAAIESGMGIAMLSTLYGILAARLLCLPAADRLLQKEDKRNFRHYMITEGLAMLAQKQKPYFVQDRLNSFLEPSRHIDLGVYLRSSFPQPAEAMM